MVDRRASCIYDNDNDDDDDNDDDEDVVEIVARGKVTRRSNGTRLADT